MERSQTSPSITTSEILRDVLARKMSRNPAFSLRAFARDLGVSHTYLSLVLNGKKSLSLKKVVQFSQLLQLDEREAELFMKAGALEARGRADQKAKSSVTKSPRQKKQEEAEDTFFEFDMDRFRMLCDWYHLPILELTFTKDFQSDPVWIGRRLSISPEQVRNAIDRLKRLGLLEECGGKLTKTKAKVAFTPKGFEKAMRDFYQQMIAKASEALESGHPEDFEARDVTGSTMAIDPAKLPEARKKIDAFRRSMLKYLTNGESSEVYQLNVQLFPVTGRRSEKSKSSVVKRGVK